MEYKDYYKLLGVSRNATQDDIKKAFKKLAKQYHPDLNPNDKKKAEEKFKEINEAYQVLGEPEKRSRYDQLGSDWDRISSQDTYSGARAQHFGNSTFSDFFETFFGGQNINNMEDLLGGLGAKHAARSYEIDHEYDIEITLRDAINGSKQVLNVPFNDTCPACGGTGYTVKTAAYRGRNISSQSPCPNCGGSGAVRRNKAIEVKIPKGVKQGAKIRLSGEGGIDPRTGKRGSIYLNIRIKPPYPFMSKEQDLYLDVKLYPFEAALGKSIDIPSPTGGTISLKIPAGTQNEQMLKLKDKGIPSSSGTGDLYVKIHVAIPKDLSQEERQLLEQWDKLRSWDNPRKGL